MVPGRCWPGGGDGFAVGSFVRLVSLRLGVVSSDNVEKPWRSCSGVGRRAAPARAFLDGLFGVSRCGWLWSEEDGQIRWHSSSPTKWDLELEGFGASPRPTFHKEDGAAACGSPFLWPAKLLWRWGSSSSWSVSGGCLASTEVEEDAMALMQISPGFFCLFCLGVFLQSFSSSCVSGFLRCVYVLYFCFV